MQPMRLYTRQQMPISADVREVLLRLGMRQSDDAALLRRVRQVLQPLMPSGCMMLTPLLVQEEGVELAGRAVQSRALAKSLQGCEFALVMLSTLGEDITGRIKTAFGADRADQAVVLDAAASVAADAGLDFLMQDASRMLRPYNKSVQKRRFSPGYADCGMQNQRILLDLLGDQSLGVTLTPSFMLQPEKSVLAIGGVKHA